MNQLLEKLNQLNIKLFLKGDSLDVQAPKGAVTPNILEEIKTHKNEIVSFLKDISSKTTIQRSEERENYPLSSTQKRMWLLHQMNPENVAYHIPMMLEIEGNLNIDKLQRTFGYLVKRHESLRTIFQEDNQGNPIQIIKEFSEDLFQLNFTDSNIEENIHNEINTPFDLTKDVLLRGTVFKIADNKYLLLIVMHHIISDGWSIEVLAKDFFEVYKNVDNEEFNFEDLKIQYKDYAIWQQEKIKDQKLDKEYWLSLFNGEIPILELPSYKARPKHKSGKGNTISAQFGAQELSLFQKLCSDNGATLFMGLKSLVDILLFKYSHQNEIIVGTPIANREYPELQDQIGFYTNTLALKANIDSSQSFLNLLNNNKSQLLEAYKHQEYPFDELVGNLKLFHDPSRNPLFDVMVSFQEKFEDVTSQLENLVIRKLFPKDLTSKFDLTFSFYIEGRQLNLDLTYDTEIYDEKQSNDLIQHLTSLLSKVVENRESLIKDIDILTLEERHQLLHEFNDTKVDYPSDKTIVQLFEEQVEKTPENIAVVFEDTELTYRELNEQANQLGDYLRQKYHIKSDDLVAIKLERSEQMIVAILGILKSGAAYVPIDPEYPQERIEYIELDTQAKVTIDAAFLESYQEELKKEERQYTKQNLQLISRPDSLAYVIYTSGTTGQPKGVMIENKGLINLCQWHNKSFDVRSNSKSTLFSGQGFDASVWEIFPYLLTGGCLYPLTNEMKYDINKLSKYYLNKSITHSYLPPVVLKELLEKHDIKNTTFLSGGEALDSVYIKNNNVFNNYGPSESSVVTTYYKLNPNHSYPSVPIGVPISNTRVYILDEDFGVVPIGVSGTLYVSGVGLSRGYLNKPELTSEKFIANPFEEGTKMYDTGDLARWLPDGNIEFLGRKDFQVKIRGYRIELGEIETHISQFSTTINQVVAEAKEVNGEKVLVAYYTKDSAANIDKTELREYLQSKLPEYMVPGFFVELESIPLTPNGKIDRKALPSVSGEDLIRREYVAPRNETEQKLVEIWQEVLGVEKVGITDNFFELGGHSLMVAQVLNRIHQNLAMQVNFKDFFASPTIEGITKSLTSKEYTPIPKATEQESYPLTSSQQRLWVLSQLEGGSQAYNMPAVVTLRGELNEAYFEKAFQYLIDRHEILRTSFKSDKATGEIRQYITPKEEVHFTIEVLDFAGKVESEVEDYLQTANNEAFNLEESPLIRASLLRRDNKKHLFFLSMHHIIGDGWSTEVLVSEVVENYNNLLNGNVKEDEILKEELAIQYKDYAVWLQEEIKGDKYQKAEAYWLEQFEGELPVLELPSYKTRPLIQTYNGNNISHLFSKEFTEKLKKYSEQHGVTLFMTLMAGIKALLYRYTGQQDIIVGTPIAGREHPDLENQIGLYLNTLAIRTRLEEGHNTFESVLAKEKETLLSAYEHQLYPFDELVGKLNIKRDTSRSALFDVLVVFQNQGQLQIGNKQNNIEDLQVEGYDYHRKTSQFDVSYTFAEEGEQLALTIEYNTDIYDEFLIQRMFVHFENLLRQAIQNTEDKEDKTGTTAIEEIDFLTEQERDQLLHKFNDTKIDYPSDKTIVELFEQQVEKTPENVAVVFEDIELTYRELNEQANQLGDYLRQNYHIQPDDLVAIKLERSEKMIVAILGILKSGAAYVPIDPEYPQERIDYIEQDTQAKVTIDAVFLESYQEELKKEERQYTKENLPIISRPDSLAYVIYTSGTTGQPKGVMIENRSVINLILGQTKEFQFGDKESVFLFSNYTFDASVEQIFLALLNGGELHMPPKKIIIDQNLLENYVKDKKITHFHAVPSILSKIVFDEKINLKRLISGGDICTESVVKKFTDTDISFYNEYGPTETTVTSIELLFIKDKISIGRPITNTRVYIVDENLNIVPIGVIGNLYISGAGLSRGYLNKPDLTAEKFINNPFESGAKIYDTGDLARWLPDGNIEFLGRKDFQVKIRGFRIELGEIETNISQFSKSIGQVVADAKEVNGEKELIAYYTTDKETVIEKTSLREYLQSKLPEYMIPAFFVELNAIPLTYNGKIDHGALPGVTGEDLIRREYIAPRNVTEDKLTKIWQEVLKVEKVSVTDNFFELGGHSLSVMRILQEINRQIRKKLSYERFIELATIEKQAAEIKNADIIIPVIDRQENDTNKIKASEAQKEIWVSDNLIASNSYSMPLFFLPQKKVNFKRFESAFEKLIEQQEVFRYGIQQEEGDLYWVRKLFNWKEACVKVKAELDEVSIENIKTEALNFKFEPSENPLIKLILYEDDDRQFIVININHIIADGKSLEIIKFLLEKFYEDINFHFEKEPFYTNLVYNSPPVSNEYWEKKLKGIESFNLNYEIKEKQACSSSLLLEKSEIAEIAKICTSHNVSEFQLLICITHFVLSRYTSSNFVIGIPFNNRENEHELIVGNFLIMLPIMLQRNETELSVLIKNMKKSFSEAFENRYYDAQKLRNDFGLSGKGLFQVTANYNNNSTIDESISINENKFQLSFHFIRNADEIELSLFSDGTLADSALISQILLDIKSVIKELSSKNNVILNSDMLPSVQKITPFEISENVTQEEWIIDIFDKVAERYPEKVAIVMGEDRLTYREVQILSQKIAKALVEEHGVNYQGFVCVNMHKTIFIPAIFIGILRAGAIYVPLTPDTDDEKKHLIFNEINFDVVITETLLSSILNNPNKTALSKTKEGEIAYMLYTSGTSGIPKGVLSTTKGILDLIRGSSSLDFTSQDVLLSSSSIMFDATIFDFWLALLSGAKLVLVDKLNVLDFKNLELTVKQEKVTSSLFTSWLFNQLTDSRISIFEGFRIIISGGDIMNGGAVRKLKKTYPHLRIFNAYGPTENTVISTIYEVDSSDESILNNIPIGMPVGNSCAYVLNEERQRVPYGIKGELAVSGVRLSLGYWNREKENQDKFGTVSFDKNEKAYFTGDVVKWNLKGALTFHGRKDRQVKIRGIRIELEGIANVVRQNEKVIDCFISVMKDEKKAIVCYFTASDLSEKELENFLRKRLSRDEIPEHFVLLDKFPVSQNGKVDFNLFPSPVSGKIIQTGISDLYSKVAKIWKSLLKLDEVQEDTHFFKSGGDSILAASFLAELRKEIGLDVQISQLFNHPELIEFINIISTTELDTDFQISKAEWKEKYRLSNAQERLWLFENLYNQKGIAYVAFIPYKITGNLDIKKFERACWLLVEKHQILRTSFQVDQGIPYQVIRENIFSVEKFSCSEDQVIQKINELNKREINLASDLPFQVHLVTVNNTINYAIFRIHHIIVDEASMYILMQELQELLSIDYLVSDNISPLNIQFKDFSEWHNKLLEGPQKKILEDYWKAKLEKQQLELNLPFDFIRPAEMKYKGERIFGIIDERLKEDIKLLGKYTGSTYFNLLMVAIKVTLFKLTHQNSISVGIPISRRNVQELKNQIGLYLNTVVLYDVLHEEDSLLKIIERITNTIQEAIQYQDYPYDHLIDLLDFQRQNTRNPLFDVWVVMNSAPKTNHTEAKEDLIWEEVEINHSTSKFDLVFKFIDQDEHTKIVLEYNTELFSNETAKRILKSTEEIISKITINNLDKTLENLINENENVSVIDDLTNEW